MARTLYGRGMGWIPDYPDFRDYSAENENVAPILAKVAKLDASNAAHSVDLREWCSPVEDQGHLNSCTANAGVGMVEYFERRAFGKHIDASRLFLYKTSRNLLHLSGDNGAYLRTTMGALVLFGVPPEEYWPYDAGDVEKEPPAFCYAFAQNYNAIQYYRLDPPGTTAEQLLKKIKGHLSRGLPLMFGFTVYSSIVQAETTGRIPFPTEGEKVEGGHAVMAVGFDDKMKIANKGGAEAETTGALLVRNSWGTDWGEGGYCWLPYEYVLAELAIDWWTLVKSEWIDTGKFA